VAPVAGNIFQAQCRWCLVEFCASYQDLKHHMASAKHITKAVMYSLQAKTEVSAQLSSVLGKESSQQGDCLFSVIMFGVTMLFNVL